jgi:hypothetical protein
MIVLKRILWMLVLLLAVTPLWGDVGFAAEGDKALEVKAELARIFNLRAESLVTGNMEVLKTFYTPEQLSRFAFMHEKERTRYVHTWADKRAIKISRAESGLRINRLSVSGNTAKVSLVQSLRIGYVYCNTILPEQWFGVGTRHFLTLRKTEGAWKIAKEWYLDPLEENPEKVAVGPGGLAPSVKANEEVHDGKKYKRASAVHYANKYAGAAWGAGNRHRYNNHYLDYTGKGGDCTNFASQAIGDPKEGGGLPMWGSWRYFDKSGGTQTWVQTDSFSRYLMYSGFGRLVGKGTYQQVVAPTAKYPDGAISQLQPGDLIGYIMENDDTDHFSIVVGHDAHGYPLVNSHTADRYRVPFDLGWDKNTKYQLFHIQD